MARGVKLSASLFSHLQKAGFITTRLNLFLDMPFSPQILETGKNNATFFFHKTIRKVFRTYPGQITLNLFDWSVDSADRLLRKVNPPTRSPRKRKVTRAVAKKMQKETGDASEDSGTCDTIEKQEKELKPSETVEVK